ncbi:MAG TPA: type II toxin-antitoxin system PemK/MazF family toxin [Gaiella sp.]|nr:type II toxin-antitoxin system PemK/MazF family toxin [Gaiella sp.]
MPGKARWGQVWWVDMQLDERKRFVVVSENGWNETFATVLGVRLSTSPRRDPGPGFPLVRRKPPTIALCGQVGSLPEEALVELVDHLTPTEMRQVAIGLLEVTQAHRVLGITHPAIAERIGERRRPR